MVLAGLQVIIYAERVLVMRVKSIYYIKALIFLKPAAQENPGKMHEIRICYETVPKGLS